MLKISQMSFRQSTYKNRILMPRLFPDSYRDTEDEEYRFDPTDLMDGIPKFNFVHKLLQDGTPQKPALAKGQFVPRNWKELREWEDGTSFKTSMKNSLLNLFQKRMKMKKEQVAELEQANRRGLNHQLNRLFSPNLKRYNLLKQLQIRNHQLFLCQLKQSKQRNIFLNRKGIERAGEVQ